MLFYEDGKKVRYNPYDMKRDPSCGAGTEVEAYKVNDKVVKFYKRNCKKIRMDKKTCNALSKIDTKRILMPETSLLDKKRNIQGYTMEYIEDIGKDSFFKLPKEELKEEIEKLEEDITQLSDNAVEIRDILEKTNTVFHNGVYLIDPGSYSIGKKNDEECIKIYGKNMDHINEYLLRLITERAETHCSDSARVSEAISKLKKEIYSNKIDPITYLKNIPSKNLDELIDKYIKEAEFKCTISGKKLDIESWPRMHCDDRKEIYINKKDGKILYLYKTRKSELKLSKEELEKIEKVSTKRIMTPTDSVNVSRDNYKAYQIKAIPNCIYEASSLNGKVLSREFELLKKDAQALAKEGIYIGQIDADDLLCTKNSLYVRNIEKLEYSKDSFDLEEKNIDSLNRLVTSLITDELYLSTTLRNTCVVLNSIRANGGYIGDTIKEELESSANLNECVKKMVKTRGKNNE